MSRHISCKIFMLINSFNFQMKITSNETMKDFIYINSEKQRAILSIWELSQLRNKLNSIIKIEIEKQQTYSKSKTPRFTEHAQKSPYTMNHCRYGWLSKAHRKPILSHSFDEIIAKNKNHSAKRRAVLERSKMRGGIARERLSPFAINVFEIRAPKCTKG